MFVTSSQWFVSYGLSNSKKGEKKNKQTNKQAIIKIDIEGIGLMQHWIHP
jgi:hypothetical protein